MFKPHCINIIIYCKKGSIRSSKFLIMSLRGPLMSRFIPSSGFLFSWFDDSVSVTSLPWGKIKGNNRHPTMILYMSLCSSEINLTTHMRAKVTRSLSLIIVPDAENSMSDEESLAPPSPVFDPRKIAKLFEKIRDFIKNFIL